MKTKPMNDDKDIVNKSIYRSYDVFLMLTKLEYQPTLIKEESTSELRYWVGIVPYSYHNIQKYGLCSITRGLLRVFLRACSISILFVGSWNNHGNYII